MILKKQEGKIVFEPRLFVSRAKGDVLANGSILYARVGGDTKLNASLGYAGVDGNAKVNIGGFGAGVIGDAKVNAGGLVAGVDGNARVNASLGFAEVNKSYDYTIGDIIPRITKYLPECIRKINLPAINFGAFTTTKDPYNSFILGLFNNIKDTENDYLALGLVNRITDEDGKTRYALLCSGKVHVDGIFKHKKYKNLEEKNEEIK